MKNEGFPIDISTERPLITSRKLHPSNGSAVPVVDGLVGVTRALDIGCIFTALKFSKKCFCIFLDLRPSEVPFKTNFFYVPIRLRFCDIIC